MLSLKLTELPGAQLSDFPCSRALRGQNAAHAPPPSRGRLRGVDASMSARAAAAASAMSCTLRACPWRPWRRVAAMGRQSPPPSRHSCGASPSDALEARAVRASPTPAQLSRRRRGVVRSELVQRGRGLCLRARQRASIPPRRGREHSDPENSPSCTNFEFPGTEFNGVHEGRAGA